ncbi:MAG: MBL fold metallo-hydrolase [Clostridiales bacterium]|nr:MBL fold metallo-hydrolase [Clostridiales bacterium]
MQIINTGHAVDYICNTYVVFDEESCSAAVIDPGLYDENLKKAINENSLNVEKIILTHGHFDHILGVSGLKEATGACVYIHPLDAEMLRSSEKSLLDLFGIGVKQIPVDYDKKLCDGDTVSVGDSAFSVLHTPGHTRGSCCFVNEKDKVIFSGDTLFCRTVGRTDFSGGSAEDMMHSIKRLISLPGDYRVFTGHNIPTTLESERNRNIFIRRMNKG